jgi:hypothetical protein
MRSKAAKTDIAAIEYVLADLDPHKGESSEAAKARFLGELNGGAFKPRPTAAVDSGNGIQLLWRLRDRIELGEPIKNGKIKNGEEELEYLPEDQAKIDDVEARSKSLMLKLGSKAGTQNIDRILRLPGTINHPNKVKLKRGCVECPSALLWFEGDGAAYPLSDLPKSAPEQEKKKNSGETDKSASGKFFSHCAKMFECGLDIDAVTAEFEQHPERHADTSLARYLEEGRLAEQVETCHEEWLKKHAEDAEIIRLAKLSAVDYEHARKEAAEKLGVRTTILDKLVQAERVKLGLAEEVKTAADTLIDLAGRAQELFHAPDGTAFATIPLADHLETWSVRSKGFRKWLAREYFNETTSAPNSDAIQSALNVIEARAHFDSVERAVYMRVGAHEGRMYLDLVDKCWRAVEISADGWRIVERPPIPFRRSAGMRALPEPVRGGKINELREFLNIGKDGKNDGKADDKDFVLTVSFILAAFRERGPYPVLCLAGEHGSAKSTFTAILRRLIDPNSAPLRALPREDRDLFIAANNAHLLAFDNVSRMPDWISDTLCRLATGGGFATRQLYSDQDEALFDAMRPVILNGIEDIVIRPDLADRSVFLNLKNIPEDKCKAELKFWPDFEAAHPRILGALLDGVARGLRELPNTQLAKMPRMADFALWATACEGAFWEAGTFMDAYGQNREDAIGAVIEADMVATAVQKFMDERPDLKEQPSADGTQWAGTAADLLGALKRVVGEAKTRSKEWPATPRALASRVRRAAATLRKVNIEITFDRTAGGKRTRVHHYYQH